MIDERNLELIHAEFDGELSPGGHAELHRRLVADPEARRYRDAIRGVVEALNRIEEVEPPAELRPSILAAVGAGNEMLGAGASISLGRLSRPVRYAAAVAAGLVLGIAGAQFTAVRSTGLNIEELVGTMAGKQGVLPNRVDRAVLDLSGLSGSVNLYELGSTLVVEFDLASQQPIDVAVACDGRTARIDGLGSRDQPGGHYAIALASPRSPGAAVDLQFFSGGVLIHRESLRTGGAEIIGPG